MDGTGATNYTSTSIIAGNGAIVKQGTGTATINSIGNSYTGTTTVSSGMLDVRDGTGLEQVVAVTKRLSTGGYYRSVTVAIRSTKHLPHRVE